MKAGRQLYERRTPSADGADRWNEKQGFHIAVTITRHRVNVNSRSDLLGSIELYECFLCVKSDGWGRQEGWKKKDLTYQLPAETVVPRIYAAARASAAICLQTQGLDSCGSSCPPFLYGGRHMVVLAELDC